jgi:hypothetical protein
MSDDELNTRKHLITTEEETDSFENFMISNEEVDNSQESQIDGVLNNKEQVILSNDSVNAQETIDLRHNGNHTESPKKEVEMKSSKERMKGWTLMRCSGDKKQT